jgi:hypothetical protein
MANFDRADEVLGTHNRGKPSIELDEEPAIAVRESDPAAQLAPQHD